MTTNRFEYLFDAEFIRLVVIGTKENDCKSIKPETLIPGAYAGIQGLIQKNNKLKGRIDSLESELKLQNDDLKKKMNELEKKTRYIYAEI